MGNLNFVSVCEFPFKNLLFVVPAIVVTIPFVSIFRIQLLKQSATNKFPSLSKHIPTGQSNRDFHQ